MDAELVEGIADRIMVLTSNLQQMAVEYISGLLGECVAETCEGNPQPAEMPA